MGRILNSLVNCRGKKSTPPNLLKDFYFFFMLMFPFTGLFVLISGFEQFFIGLYLYLVYFGVLAVYWTPIFQDKLSINGRFLNVLMYLIQWVPFLGNISLVILKLSKRDFQEGFQTPKSKQNKSKAQNSTKDISEEVREISESKDTELSSVKKGEEKETKESETLRKSSGANERKEKLLNRLERKLEGKGYDQNIIAEIFEDLNLSNLDKSKIKTALHLTANDVQIKRILLCLETSNLTEEKIDSISEQLEEERFYSKTNLGSQEPEDLQDAADEDFLELIKNFHKRYGRDARILEKIGRRMVITDEYEPEKVYNILDKVYEIRRESKAEFPREKYREQREDLRQIAEKAREEDLDSVVESLEDLLGEGIVKQENSQSKKEEVEESETRQRKDNGNDESDTDENLSDKSESDYLSKIENFHERGGYRYRVLERIGRRLHKQGATPEDVYSLISEFSDSDSFEKIELEKLEEVATQAETENFEQIESNLNRL